MPVGPCQSNGRPGWKWGETGKCYTFTAGDPEGSAAAYAQAAAQGAAVEARRHQVEDHQERLPARRIGWPAWHRHDAQGRPRLGARYPDAIQARYMDWALKRVQATHDLTMRRLKAPLEAAAPVINAAAKQDADQVERRDQNPDLEAITRRLVKVVQNTATAWDKAAPSGQLLLFSEARALDVAATSHLSRQIKRVYGVDVLQDPRLNQEILATWVAENVDLIVTIDARYFADIERVIKVGLDTGTNTRELTTAFAGRFGVSQSRARLIVRDQIGKLNGQITRARQEEIGVSSFVWRNSEDERVRDEHLPWPEGVADHEWTWADGAPDEGYPGQPIQCRCIAEPVISDPSLLRTRGG